MGKPKKAPGAPSGPALVVSVNVTAGFVLLVLTEAKVYVTQNQEYVCDLDEFSKFFGEEDVPRLHRAYDACAPAFARVNDLPPRFRCI